MTGGISIKKRVPVKDRLRTVISQDGQQEQFNFQEVGEFIELNGKHYLRYQEHQNGQVTPVQFRLDEEEVHLHRQGATETRLVFDRERPTISRYQTEYGALTLRVVTSQLERQVDPLAPAGRLVAAYQLRAGDQLIGSYRLELQFTA
jgi:uncharacterized beta-barrel protein YwiB (DUF1934 family)